MWTLLAALVAIAPCQPPEIVLGTSTTAPSGFTEASIVSKKDPQGGATVKVADGKLTLTQETLALSGSSIEAGDRAVLWSNPNTGAQCLQTISGGPATAGTAVGGQSPPLEPSANAACEAQGKVEADGLTGELGGKPFTLIALNRGGRCYINRPFGTVGDPIYVGYYSTGELAYGPKLTPCNAESATPTVTGDLRGTMHVYPPWMCFNTALTVEIPVNIAGKESTVSAQLIQYERFRASVQLGVLYTPQHFRSFGVADQDGKKVIGDLGPEGKGPEYLALVTIHGVPHYLHQLVGGPRYLGRDVVNENALADRIGLTAGVGFNKPLQRFALGLTLEVFRGVSVMGAFDFARAKELNGMTVGDPFAGKPEEIPTTERWSRRWTWGMTLDARYALAIFSKK